MNIRSLALEALNKITIEKGYANLVVNDFLRNNELSEEDTSFFSKLVYGTLENLLFIDYQMEPYLRKAQKNWVLNLLRLAFYQLLFLAVPDYAAINEAVVIAKEKHPAIGSFVNAVLRNFQRNGQKSLEGLDPKKRLSIQYSHPEWLVDLLIRDYGFEETEKILASEKEERPLFIRVNNLSVDRDFVIKNLEKNKIRYEETCLENAFKTYGPIQKTKMFYRGQITIQDLSAQFVSLLADPKNGDKVIDLCAAPGGKSAHMADLMDNQGEIFACDIHPHKISLMENGFKRLLVKNVHTKLLDARDVNKVFETASFALVLADVPCSGLGVVSHKADLKYRLDEKTIEDLIKLQSEILEASWSLVKPGGYYLYSTCTLNKDENERQMTAFINRHPDFEIIEEKKIMPYDYQSDGFYICKLRRIV
ncbi:MAG: 16S rRNA (cytosine(967)-C(5))-methyltransferase RsmB [Bacilli bacterium]|nr:16S rRNA (cytosine(967)-C(5))-methyltransferase RsmB [Bacilli bacterium]